MEASRYLAPNPVGILPCLGLDPSSDERRLFEYIVMAGRPRAVDLPAFSEILGISVADIARTVFALNRTRRITVLEEAPSDRDGWAETGLSGLTHDLVALAAPGQKLLLAGSDGMCIARVGWSPYEADVMAARTQKDLAASQPEIWPVIVGEHRFLLSASAMLDQRHPALLRLAYRLLHGLRLQPKG